MYKTKTLTGIFNPKNPKKYKGNAKNIVFRSSWELRIMKFFDEQPSILEWQSEEFCIVYTDPFTGKTRRYFPDFCVKKQLTDGTIEINIIEVKPFYQTQEPKVKLNQKNGKPSKTFLTEAYTYAINTEKWKAAKQYCDKRNIKFIIMTEKELGI